MRKIAFGAPMALSALILIAVPPQMVAAQESARTDFSGHNSDVAKVRARLRQAAARAVLTRSYRNAPPTTQLTWKENPALMDSSWRLWPSLVDF